MTTSLFFLMWGLATALAMPLLLQFHASGVPGVRAFMLANALTVLSLLLYAAGSFLPLNATVMVSMPRGSARWPWSMWACGSSSGCIRRCGAAPPWRFCASW